MGLGKARAGAAVEPSIETSGTDNDLTAPRVVKFNSSARPVYISIPATFNASIVVKINALAANDFDNDSDDDGPGYFTVAAGETRDLSERGCVSIERVSFCTQNAGDDLDDVSVVGWTAASS